MKKTYKILRFYQDESIEKETIDTGLTLKEAQKHYKDDSTHGTLENGTHWFDGYTEE